MDDANDEVSTAANLSFPSFIALRARHSELLQVEPETEDAKARIMVEVEDFIGRAQATGAMLSDEDERRGAQSILNYWVSVLYRMDGVARPGTLNRYDAQASARLDDVACPYPGVRPFSENECRLFFGRQRQIDYMVGRLKVDRLLVIVGPSGSGKTSLVQAGLFPALNKERGGEQEHFVFSPLLPGREPLISLARMISKARQAANQDQAVDPLWPGAQVELFRHDKRHLLKLIEETTDKPAVIFIDQGEELFEPGDWLSPVTGILGLNQSKRTIEPFLANLMGVAHCPNKKHIVIIARRIGDFERHTRHLPQGIRDAFEPARVVLPALSANELRDAIQKPAELLGVKFDETVSHGLPAAEGQAVKPAEPIVQSLVKEISSEPTGLPLLQFTLVHLWESRAGALIPETAFHKTGGCRATLARSADEFYQSLAPFEQFICRRLLTRLVRLDPELKARVSPVRRTALYGNTERHLWVDSLIERLEARQLLRVMRGETKADDWIELIHDSLIANWPALNSWIESKRAARRWLRVFKAAGIAAAIVIFALAVSLTVGWALQFSKSRDLARLSNKQLANDRLDLALLLGIAAYQTDANTSTRSNLHKLLYRLQFMPRPKRILRREGFEASDVSFSSERDGNPGRLASVDPDGRIVVWDLHWNGPRATEHVLVEKSNATGPIIFNPDGKTLATASSDPGVAVILWDLTSGQREDLLASLIPRSPSDSDYNSPTLNLVFKPDGKTLFSVSDAGRVIQWDRTGPVRATSIFQNPIAIVCLALNPKGDVLAAGDDDGAVFLLDVSGKSGKPKQIAQGHGTPLESIFDMAFSSTGMWLAVSQLNQTMLWPADGEGKPRAFCSGLPASGLFVGFGDHDKKLLGYSPDGTFLGWEILDGTPLKHESLSPSQSISFSFDGKLLALPNGNGIVIWDVSSDGALRSSDPVNGIAFRPGTGILAVTTKEEMTTWRVDGSEPNPTAVPQHSELLTLAYSSDGALSASGLKDGTIVVRNANTTDANRSLKRKAVDDSTFVKIVFAARAADHRLAEAHNIDSQTASEIALWNADTGEQQVLARNAGSIATALAFRPDGGLLAWATTNTKYSTVSLWSPGAQQPQDFTIPTEAKVTSLAFSPSKKILAVGWSDGKIELRDESYKLIVPIEGVGTVVDLAFSPDGSILASASNPNLKSRNDEDDADKARVGTIILWDMSTFKGNQPEQLGDFLKGNTGAIASMAFSNDGNILAVGYKDTQIILWDLNLAGARNRFSYIVDFPRTYTELASHGLRLDNENLFQSLYRKVRRRPSLSELAQ